MTAKGMPVTREEIDRARLSEPLPGIIDEMIRDGDFVIVDKVKPVVQEW